MTSTGSDIDLQALGEEVATEIDRLFPGQAMFGRCLALAEEAGEVCRAVLKRDYVVSNRRAFKGLDEAGWTANLRVELAQRIGVALDIAVREGFDITEDLLVMLIALRQREPLAFGDESWQHHDGEVIAMHDEEAAPLPAENKVVDLMAALEASLAEAKAARKRPRSETEEAPDA